MDFVTRRQIKMLRDIFYPKELKMASLNHHCSSSKRLGQFVPGGARPLMAMVEVTNRCNMACPICFSGADRRFSDVSVFRVEKYLRRLLEITETPIQIQISGGEPTMHDDLSEIIATAKQIGYRNIELITNGVKIAQDPSLLYKLKENGLSSVYLQFDGLNKKTHLKIRGRDMTAVRQQAVEAIRNAGLCCTLAVVVTRGVNEGEIGNIVQFAIDRIDVVRAISFQSATRFSGRFELNDGHGGFEMQELLNLIETQTGVPSDSFLSEHLGHPGCNAMSLVFPVNGKLEPLFKYIRQEDVIEFLKNDGRQQILGAFAGKKDFFFRHLTSPVAWKLIAKAAPIFGKNPYNVLRRKHILLFAKSFMDKDTLDTKRIDSCCYGITGEEGVFSFCAYNNLYRFHGQD
ncbi:MAG: radical SAM protein [Desulfobacterales bacterium]|jgi:uncharacterized radical SAM superfamily Fe-S cluster-containing enzyme